MIDSITLLEKGIMEKLPQVPYVLDQVGAAMDWRKEVETEADYRRALEVTMDVCDYVHKISEGNFYKAHLVTAFILAPIKDVLSNDRFDLFRSASGAIEDTVAALVPDNNLVLERGLFKAAMIKVSELSRTREDCLTLILFQMLSNLKEITMGMKEANVKTPITKDDLVTVLGYSLIITNLKASNVVLLNTTSTVLNEVLIILNSELNY